VEIKDMLWDEKVGVEEILKDRLEFGDCELRIREDIHIGGLVSS